MNYCLSNIQTKRLMLFTKIDLIYRENLTKHTDTLCGQNEEFFHYWNKCCFSNHCPLVGWRTWNTCSSHSDDQCLFFRLGPRGMDVSNFSINSSVQDQTRIKSIKLNKERKRKKILSKSSLISETAPHLFKGSQVLTFCPSGDPLGFSSKQYLIIHSIPFIEHSMFPLPGLASF